MAGYVQAFAKKKFGDDREGLGDLIVLLGGGRDSPYFFGWPANDFLVKNKMVNVSLLPSDLTKLN